MRKTPPPPRKNQVPKIPPPRAFGAQSYEERPAPNLYEEQQERPEKVTQPVVQSENFEQKTIEDGETTSPAKQQYPREIDVEAQTKSNNFEDNNFGPIGDNTKKEETSVFVAPAMKGPPPPKATKGKQPPAIRRPGPPPSIQKKQLVAPPVENNYEQSNNIEKTENVNNFQPEVQAPSAKLSQENPQIINTPAENNQLQIDNTVHASVASMQETSTPINSSQSITSLVKNIPSPPKGQRIATKGPSPLPKINRAKIPQKQEEIPKTEQQSGPEQKIEQPKKELPQKTSSVSQIPVPKQAVQIKSNSFSEIQETSVTKSSSKSKLQLKLQELKRARDLMAQQQDQNDEQDCEEVGTDQILEEQQETNPKQCFEEQLKQKINYGQRVAAPQIQVVEQNNHVQHQNQKEQKLQQLRQTENEFENVQIPITEAQKKQSISPPQTKAKSPPPINKTASPPNNIPQKRSVPNFPTKQKIVSPEENLISSNIEKKSEVQKNVENNDIIAPKKTEEVKIVSQEPSNKAKRQIVEATVPQHSKSPTSELNLLLEKYQSLKNTYLDNICQLQELIHFNKTQQQQQIHKISFLLGELGKRNDRLKEFSLTKGKDAKLMNDEVSQEVPV